MTTAAAHAGLDVLMARRQRNPREIIHAILYVPLRAGECAPLDMFDRVTGEAVCGEPGELGEPPAALWEPVITCPACAVLVRAWGVELRGCSL